MVEYEGNTLPVHDTRECVGCGRDMRPAFVVEEYDILVDVGLFCCECGRIEALDGHVVRHQVRF